MATIFAPRSFRARIAWVIRLTCVATALVPQMTTTIGFCDLVGEMPDMRPVPGDIAGPGDADADRAEKARVALGVGEPLDAVAHHEAHRARIEIRPDAFGAVLALDRRKASATRSSASSQPMGAN